MLIPSFLPALSGRRFLFIGQWDDIPMALRDKTLDAGVAMTLGALDQRVISRVKPKMIVSPLLCAQHDILDVAHALLDLNYHGDLVAISRKLPHFAMVQDEVSEIWTGGQFRIIEADQLLH